MNELITRKSVTFLHPFSLAGIEEILEAGTYIVETLEELIEGLSFVAYRRVSTTIVTAGKGYGQAVRQVITIDLAISKLLRNTTRRSKFPRDHWPT